MNDLRFEIQINAPVEKIYSLWTKKEGLQSFMSSQVNIDAVVGGKFEIYFDPQAPEGEKGSEGCVYLSLQKNEMVSFTWNSPPQLASIRNQKTYCRVLLASEGEQTRLTFDHFGLGLSEIWQQNRQYFTRAWGGIVLPRCKIIAEGGNIDLNSTDGLESLVPVY